MKTQKGDIIKLVLAGTDVTILCSVLMRHGIAHISRLEKEVSQWMEESKHSSLRELKGSLSHKNCADPSAFERDQYVRARSTYKPLFLQRR